jgi:hypothetical protein
MQAFLDSKHLVKEKILHQQLEGMIEENEPREQHVEEDVANQMGLTLFLSIC